MDSELLERVSELRGKGRTPKEIARVLGLKPADVMPVIRAIGAQAPRREAPVAGCWVTDHWVTLTGLACPHQSRRRANLVLWGFS